MNISEAAAASSLPVKTVRYYADIGLVAPKRAGNGYRIYDDAMVEKLRFVGRARQFDFSVDECRELLALYEDRQRPSAAVKGIASTHLAAIDQRLTALQGLRDTLATLVDGCAGDDRPDCPILEGLAK
ncbi:MAG: MerR family DNA-binding protein [Alphaproteobacteria bacterium]